MEKNENKTPCPDCEGNGWVTDHQSVNSEADCSRCNSTGYVSKPPLGAEGERTLSFERLKGLILAMNAKSEYKQAAIVMLRTVFQTTPPPKETGKSLQECKDEVALRYVPSGKWYDLMKYCKDDHYLLNICINYAANLYASQTQPQWAKEQMWLAYKASNTVWAQDADGLRIEFDEWYNSHPT